MSGDIACSRLEFLSVANAAALRRSRSGIDEAGEFGTRYSRYGWGFDVRATYAHLPCQWFWTWLTGKYPTQREPRRPAETLLTPWQLGLQLAWSWGLIATSLVLGAVTYRDPDIGLVTKAICTLALWVVVTNRTRGLLHTFH